MTSIAARTPNPRGQGERLRHDLVDAAREQLLTTREVTPLSLRAVAKAVGVSPTAVYGHFDSAAGLVVAVLVDQSDALRGALRIREAPIHDAAQLAEVGQRYVRWGLANPGGYQLLFESADRLGDHGGPGSPGWDIIAARGGGRPVPAPAALAFRAWSSLHGLVSLRLHKPMLPWPTGIEQEVAAISAALLPRPTNAVSAPD